jgi:signal transduction histidine kinase
VALRARNPGVDELREALAQIADTTRQLNARVSELLAVARGEEDAMTLSLERCDLRHVVASAVDSLRARAEMQQLQLTQCLPEQPCMVNADPARLRQLVQVLLDNALRYTPPGGRVDVEVKPAALPSGVLGFELSVTDTGIGLVEAERPLLFDRHFRGSNARQFRPDGVGLGLPIAQTIAQAHGAQLVLHSRPDGGTQAVLLIAQAETNAAAAA